jgi:hypothetical protein
MAKAIKALSDRFFERLGRTPLGLSIQRALDAEDAKRAEREQLVAEFATLRDFRLDPKDVATRKAAEDRWLSDRATAIASCAAYRALHREQASEVARVKRRREQVEALLQRGGDPRLAEFLFDLADLARALCSHMWGVGEDYERDVLRSLRQDKPEPLSPSGKLLARLKHREVTDRNAREYLARVDRARAQVRALQLALAPDVETELTAIVAELEEDRPALAGLPELKVPAPPVPGNVVIGHVA